MKILMFLTKYVMNFQNTGTNDTLAEDKGNEPLEIQKESDKLPKKDKKVIEVYYNTHNDEVCFLFVLFDNKKFWFPSGTCLSAR